MNVQTWLEENNPPLPAQTYESVPCPGCTRLQFINVSTGKLFGEKDQEKKTSGSGQP
jgi:hypothetical protein